MVLSMGLPVERTGTGRKGELLNSCTVDVSEIPMQTLLPGLDWNRNNWVGGPIEN